MTKEERNEAKLAGLTSLEIEMERIFGSNGLMDFVQSKIEMYRGLLENGNEEVHTIEHHNNLVNYRYILEERMNF
jgi:hypothetical protein